MPFSGLGHARCATFYDIGSGMLRTSTSFSLQTSQKGVESCHSIAWVLRTGADMDGVEPPPVFDVLPSRMAAVISSMSRPVQNTQDPLGLRK